MMHYLKIEGKSVDIDCYCGDPEEHENNTCSYGKCEKCRYGKATMSIEDAIYLTQLIQKLKGR